MTLRFRHWLLLASSLLAGSVVFLPATLLDRTIGWYSKGRVEMQQARGTLWGGSGRLVLADEGLMIGNAAWNFQPKALLQGQVRFDLSLPAGVSIVYIDWRGLNVDRLSVRLPIQALAGAVPEIGRYGLRGTLEFGGESMLIGWRYFSGIARAELHGVSSPLAKVAPLGTFRLDVTGHGDQGAINLSSRPENAILAEGTGRIEHGIPTFQGRVTAAAPHKETLGQFISAISGGADTIPLRL